MMGWTSTSVWWETTVSVMMMEIKSRWFFRIPLPSLSGDGIGWAGKGLTPSFPHHVLVYQPAGKEYTKTDQVLLPLSSEGNQWKRFRNSFALLQLFLLCQWCRDNPHRLTECTTAMRHREAAYFFIRCLRTEQKLELNWGGEKNSYACLLRLMVSIWGGNCQI